MEAVLILAVHSNIRTVVQIFVVYEYSNTIKKQYSNADQQKGIQII